LPSADVGLRCLHRSAVLWLLAFGVGLSLLFFLAY
jgi:hypothetical protein